MSSSRGFHEKGTGQVKRRSLGLVDNSAYMLNLIDAPSSMMEVMSTGGGTGADTTRAGSRGGARGAGPDFEGAGPGPTSGRSSAQPSSSSSSSSTTTTPSEVTGEMRALRAIEERRRSLAHEQAETEKGSSALATGESTTRHGEWGGGYAHGYRPGGTAPTEDCTGAADATGGLGFGGSYSSGRGYGRVWSERRWREGGGGGQSGGGSGGNGGSASPRRGRRADRGFVRSRSLDRVNQLMRMIDDVGEGASPAAAAGPDGERWDEYAFGAAAGAAESEEGIRMGRDGMETPLQSELARHRSTEIQQRKGRGQIQHDLVAMGQSTSSGQSWGGRSYQGRRAMRRASIGSLPTDRLPETRTLDSDMPLGSAPAASSGKDANAWETFVASAVDSDDDDYLVHRHHTNAEREEERNMPRAAAAAAASAGGRGGSWGPLRMEAEAEAETEEVGGAAAGGAMAGPGVYPTSSYPSSYARPSSAAPSITGPSAYPGHSNFDSRSPPVRPATMLSQLKATVVGAVAAATADRPRVPTARSDGPISRRRSSEAIRRDRQRGRSRRNGPGRGNLAPRRNSCTPLDGLDGLVDYDYADVYGNPSSSSSSSQYASSGDAWGQGGGRMVGTAIARCEQFVSQKCGRDRAIGMCVLLVLSAVALGLVFVDLIGGAEQEIEAHMHQGDGNRDTDGSAFGTGRGSEYRPVPVAGMERLNNIRDALINARVSRSGDFPDPPVVEVDTPQMRALKWIAYGDPIRMDLPAHAPPTSEDDADEYDGANDAAKLNSLIERYALVTLYFSTGGEGVGGNGDATGAGAGTRGIAEQKSGASAYGKKRRDKETRGLGTSGWKNYGGWLTADNVCDWYGVTCDVEFGAVVGLNLTSNRLDGTLPREIATGLSYLRILDLSDNAISLALPLEVGGMTELKTLKLVGNELSGTLPTTLGHMSNLEVLHLSDNLFSGELPHQVADLRNLHFLALNDNEFSGSIPPSIGLMSGLSVLHLDSNAFTSSIPSSFVSLDNVTDLRLSQNRLTGTIPHLLFVNMVKLETLYLDNNDLDSTIPSLANVSIGASPPMRDLQLHGNSLNGTLPASLNRLVNLETIYLDHNALTGTIPPEWGSFRSLRMLYLHRNRLSGPIPSELAAMQPSSPPPPLEMLALHHNQLNSTLPPELGRVETLISLTVEMNSLVGEVPVEYGRLKNLTMFNLYGNSIEGTMPGEVCNLTKGKLTQLTADCASPAIECDCCNTCF